MIKDSDSPQLLRPMQHAEHRLLTLILRGAYPPGTPLPNERLLAQEFGVTRSTLRETLQRLSREGWVTIQHGKATKVNDFWKEGGLSLLGTLARYSEYLPMAFILHLLETRALLLPGIAGLAVKRAPAPIRTHLHGRRELGGQTAEFVAFDWKLQILMARAANNPLGIMIFNDFKTIFHTMAPHYFALPKARDASRRYYQTLAQDLEGHGDNAVNIVRTAMEESITIWQEVHPIIQGGAHVPLERLGR